MLLKCYVYLDSQNISISYLRTSLNQTLRKIALIQIGNKAELLGGYSPPVSSIEVPDLLGLWLDNVFKQH